ncbi:hypothetical protein E1292_41670 [Nonomuraea deserti]|uniref:Uncharacterized protein n=1 Tax=Nonomuraea deserti TaxID=1848322 RepID=A0A4R4UQD2_9ACTN|nr:hypothetical protein [Nonomuraea deserti]TDC92486.1 hypothetical protein E1292_41670 [Nonomuraea deserti]
MVFRDAEAAAAYEATVVQRELGWSFRRQVELALKVAGAEDLRDAVRFTGEMGIIRAVAALEALEEVLADHPFRARLRVESDRHVLAVSPKCRAGWNAARAFVVRYQ